MMAGVPYNDLESALECLDIDDDQDEEQIEYENDSEPGSEFSEDEGWEETNGDDDQEDANDDDEEQQYPEMLKLILLSSLDGGPQLLSYVRDLASQELELWKGQANDCLEKLRLTLGQQALLYPTKIWKASNHKERTRAWDDVKVLRKKVEEGIQDSGPGGVWNIWVLMWRPWTSTRSLPTLTFVGGE
jgi:hypothetical protein